MRKSQLPVGEAAKAPPFTKTRQLAKAEKATNLEEPTLFPFPTTSLSTCAPLLALASHSQLPTTLSLPTLPPSNPP